MDSEYHRFILDSIQQKKSTPIDNLTLAHDLALSFLVKHFKTPETFDKEEMCSLFYREYCDLRDFFEKLIAEQN